MMFFQFLNCSCEIYFEANLRLRKGCVISLKIFKILCSHCVAVYMPEKSTDQTQSMPLNVEGVLKMQLPENQLLFAIN